MYVWSGILYLLNWGITELDLKNQNSWLSEILSIGEYRQASQYMNDFNSLHHEHVEGLW